MSYMPSKLLGSIFIRRHCVTDVPDVLMLMLMLMLMLRRLPRLCFLVVESRMTIVLKLSTK